MRTPLCLLLLAACGPTDTVDPDGDLEQAVYVTLHPLEAVARTIANGAVPVVNPLPAGADPAHWTPSREVLARYQRARLVLLNGAGYEGWVGMASLPPSRTVDTMAGVGESELISREVVTHTHGLGGEHSHGGTNGCVWLERGLLRRQALIVHTAMLRAWPEHESAFDAGMAALDARIDELDFEVDLAFPLGPPGGPDTPPPWLGGHPAHEYLARQLGVELLAFDLDPGGPLSDGDLRQLQVAVEERRARLLLWSAPPLLEVEQRLSEHLGLVSLVYDPAENPDEGDYFTIQAANRARLLDALD